MLPVSVVLSAALLLPTTSAFLNGSKGNSVLVVEAPLEAPDIAYLPSLFVDFYYAREDDELSFIVEAAAVVLVFERLSELATAPALLLL